MRTILRTCPPFLILVGVMMFMLACNTTHKVETDSRITIHAVVDINLRVQDNLEKALSFQDEFENLE